MYQLYTLGKKVVPQIMKWRIQNTKNNMSTSDVQMKLLIHSKETS